MRRAARRGRYKERDELLLRVLRESGLRLGSAVRLRVDDVILDKKDGRRPRLILLRSKGGKDLEAPIFPPLAMALREYLAREEFKGHPEHYLFHPHKNPRKPLSTRAAGEIFRKAAQKAKIEHRRFTITPHSLRHSFANALKRNGTPLDDILRLARGKGTSPAAQKGTRGTTGDLGSGLRLGAEARG